MRENLVSSDPRGTFSNKNTCFIQPMLGPEWPAPRPGKSRVISASKRTDSPAFYLPWFARQVEAGSVRVRNPLFYRAKDQDKHTTTVSLDPAQVAAIVWWS